MLYGFGMLVTYWYVRLAFRVRYVGLENIPTDRGFILACNHRSLNDPMLIAHRVPRPVHYMAKAELFRKNRLFAWVLHQVNAFPVARGSGDTSAIVTAAEIIRGGDVLGIFPEGTRSKDGTPLRPRSGAAMIAARTGADIVPCAICYGEKLYFRAPVTIRYGVPIPFETLGLDSEKSSAIRSASRRIMDEIEALLAQGV